MTNESGERKRGKRGRRERGKGSPIAPYPGLGQVSFPSIEIVALILFCVGRGKVSKSGGSE